jgi:thiamine monophosphate kinase
LALSKSVSEAAILEESRQILKRPKLPLDLASQLRNISTRIAAIDISDGLGIDLHHLADASNVGLEIYGADIPLHPIVYQIANTLGIDPLRFAFGFGGDGQFLFTIDPQYEDAAIKAGAIKIGEITASRERKLLTSGGAFDLPNFGHEDFTGEKSKDRLLRTLKEPFRK